jgi:hypothetical protein
MPPSTARTETLPAAARPMTVGISMLALPWKTQLHHLSLARLLNLVYVYKTTERMHM